VGFDINANFDATTGTVFLGAVGGLSSNTPDDVTISAKKASGAFTVGNVKGTGDVSVIASGSTSASKVGTVTGDNVTADVSSTGAGSYIGDITATTSATVTYSAIERTNYSANSAGSSGKITGSSTSTALAVKVTSGILADEIIINGGAKQTSITVTGDTGSSSDNVIVTATATTASAQTISLAGLTGYETSTITTGAKKDTIVGGAGADTITGGAGQDTLTGGAGADVFKFDSGQSTYLAPDTITDLGTTDEIWYGTGTVALSGAVTAVAGSKAKIDGFGVATFNSETTAPATLSAAATLVEASVYGLATTAGKAALFAFGGDTYMFVSNGTSGLDTNDLVIKLTGVALPNAALVDNGTDSTGLSGLGS
jgi:Ca2+-binding RTX toxin-like protein